MTQSFFRIRVAPAAAEKLEQLPPDTQSRLRQMLQDIAELADLVPPGAAQNWKSDERASLLQLQMGRVNVRYSINEENRTLTIEHVILPGEELGETGSG
jgi:mRNA-degrading endonuclease RelE of RelBE toxin-antitoxin system